MLPEGTRLIMTISDTSQQAADAQIAVLRSKTTAHRLALTLALSATTAALSKRAIRRANPKISESEVICRFVELHYGQALAGDLRAYLAERAK